MPDRANVPRATEATSDKTKTVKPVRRLVFILNPVESVMENPPKKFLDKEESGNQQAPAKRIAREGSPLSGSKLACRRGRCQLCLHRRPGGLPRQRFYGVRIRLSGSETVGLDTCILRSQALHQSASTGKSTIVPGRRRLQCIGGVFPRSQRYESFVCRSAENNERNH